MHFRMFWDFRIDFSHFVLFGQFAFYENYHFETVKMKTVFNIVSRQKIYEGQDYEHLEFLNCLYKKGYISGSLQQQQQPQQNA